MPKEKTFWVRRGFLYYYSGKNEQSCTHRDNNVWPPELESKLPAMKFGELKQFKIVEVKK